MRLKRIIAVFLTLVLYVNTVSYTIDFHYCKEEFRGINFLGKASSCHDGKSTCKNHILPVLDDEAKNCCTSQQYLLDEWNTAFVDAASPIVLELNTFVIAPPICLATAFDLVSIEPIFEKNYRPPIPAVPYSILYQSFLF
jgi:hypothetical protein